MIVIKNILKIIIYHLQLILYFVSYTVTRKADRKIVIGLTEIANILYNMKNIFHEDCITVCKNGNKYYSKSIYDIDLSKKNKIIETFFMPIIFGRLAKNASLFIYLWCLDSFLINREYDFKVLKKNNIPIACCFLGDDIRSRKLFLGYCKNINFNTFVEYDKPEIYLSDEYDNLKRIVAEQADEYASIIFSFPIDQMSYLKSIQYYFPVIINEKLFSFDKEKFNNFVPRIVHAPSLPVLKGTPLVRSVIKMLKSEGYKFDYIELINISNDDVIKELKQSHIVLNQFYTLLPGIFGHEAMSTGNAVLMSAKSNCYPYEFNNAWLETEDWQLYFNLKFLLENPAKIFEYAKNGFEYMTKYFTIKEIKKYLLDVFEKNGISVKTIND
jgi:hypothetical protein